MKELIITGSALCIAAGAVLFCALDTGSGWPLVPLVLGIVGLWYILRNLDTQEG